MYKQAARPRGELAFQRHASSMGTFRQIAQALQLPKALHGKLSKVRHNLQYKAWTDTGYVL